MSGIAALAHDFNCSRLAVFRASSALRNSSTNSSQAAEPAGCLISSFCFQARLDWRSTDLMVAAMSVGRRRTVRANRKPDSAPCGQSAGTLLACHTSRNACESSFTACSAPGCSTYRPFSAGR